MTTSKCFPEQCCAHVPSGPKRRVRPGGGGCRTSVRITIARNREAVYLLFLSSWCICHSLDVFLTFTLAHDMSSQFTIHPQTDLDTGHRVAHTIAHSHFATEREQESKREGRESEGRAPRRPRLNILCWWTQGEFVFLVPWCVCLRPETDRTRRLHRTWEKAADVDTTVAAEEAPRSCRRSASSGLEDVDVQIWMAWTSNTRSR